MIDQMNELIEELIKDEKLIPNIARLIKHVYDELIKSGFTPEQAIQIAANFKATGN